MSSKTSGKKGPIDFILFQHRFTSTTSGNRNAGDAMHIHLQRFGGGGGRSRPIGRTETPMTSLAAAPVSFALAVAGSQLVRFLAADSRCEIGARPGGDQRWRRDSREILTLVGAQERQRETAVVRPRPG